MLKHLTICVSLVLGTTPVVAQQEAKLQRIEVPGSDFGIVLAMPSTPAAPIYDLSESPDALIVHLIGGQLVLAFDDAVKMIKVVESLGTPVVASHVVRKDGTRMPFALYLAPKAE